MKTTIIATTLLFLGALGGGQSHDCLRIMTPEELSRKASLIARIKVTRAEKANLYGMFAQLVTATPLSVMEGDNRPAQINILARSNVQCAEDEYTTKQEMLVFLAPEGSIYKTLDFQYGEFLIVGDTVKNWRDKANKPSDKPYEEVRAEIEAYITAAHTPPVAPGTPPTTEPPPKGVPIPTPTPGPPPPASVPTPKPRVKVRPTPPPQQPPPQQPPSL